MVYNIDSERESGKAGILQIESFCRVTIAPKTHRPPSPNKTKEWNPWARRSCKRRCKNWLELRQMAAEPRPGWSKTHRWGQVPWYAGGGGRSVSRGQVPAMPRSLLPQCIFRDAAFQGETGSQWCIEFAMQTLAIHAQESKRAARERLKLWWKNFAPWSWRRLQRR